MSLRFAVVPDIRSTINKDGGILLDIKSGVIYSLSFTGAHVWSLLQKNEQGTTFDALLDGFSQKFEAPPAQLQTDLKLFLTDLEQKGLVRKIGVAGA